MINVKQTLVNGKPIKKFPYFTNPCFTAIFSVIQSIFHPLRQSCLSSTHAVTPISKLFLFSHVISLTFVALYFFVLQNPSLKSLYFFVFQLTNSIVSWIYFCFLIDFHLLLLLEKIEFQCDYELTDQLGGFNFGTSLSPTK